MKPGLLILVLVVLVGCSTLPAIQPAAPAVIVRYRPETSEPLDYLAWQEYVSSQPLDPALLSSLEQFFDQTAGRLITGQANDHYSPLSLYTGLAMVTAGAEGDTADELFRLLGHSPDKDQLADNISRLNQTLNFKFGQSHIRLANAIWNNPTAAFEPEFIDRLTRQYRADLFEVDFNHPETANQIGQWVSDKTEGLIRPQLAPLNQMVCLLINTLYYKDSWRHPFEDGLTQAKPFYGRQGEVEKDFLQTEETYDYIQVDGIKGAVIPLRMSRLIVLKQSGHNPADILHHYSLAELKQSAGPARLKLALPKFSFDTGYDLIPLLQQLGLEKPFLADQADFSAMTAHPAYISRIRQDSLIALDEAGIEAAAMSVIAAEEAAGDDSPVIELTLNEPFLFIIEGPDDVVLFVGTLVE